jgi:hypothetical protein
MTTTATLINIEKTNVSDIEDQKGIENYKQTAAFYLEEAEKHHLEATKHHEAGDHKQATRSTIKAHKYASLAKETLFCIECKTKL